MPDLNYQDWGPVFFPEGGTRVLVYGPLFSGLPWRGKYIEEGSAIPLGLKGQFGELLFHHLLEKDGMHLDEVHLRRLGRSRGASLAFQVEARYKNMFDYSVFKCGRRETANHLSEEYRWKKYVSPWLDTQNVAVLRDVSQTRSLKGALYSYEGIPQQYSTGYAPTLIDLISLKPQPALVGYEEYNSIFHKIEQILVPWRQSFVLDKADLAEHIRKICQPRIRQIREFIREESVEWKWGRIRIQDQSGKEFITKNPLIVLDEELALPAPVLRGLCHGDLQPGNILLRELAYEPSPLLVKTLVRPCLIDFEKTGYGFPLWDWACLEVFLILAVQPHFGYLDYLTSLNVWQPKHAPSRVAMLACALRRVVQRYVLISKTGLEGSYYAHMAALALHQVGARNLTREQKKLALFVAGEATDRMLELLRVKR